MEQRRFQSPVRLLSRYGLPIVFVLLVVGFSVALPDTYPTLFNLRSVLSDKSVVAMLALAASIPMTTQNWDLSVGFGIALLHVIAFGFQVEQGMSWPAAVGATLAVGAFLGFINGLLVTKAHIDSFIATLGTGTVALGLAQWYTGGKQIVGSVDDAFLTIARSAFGIPLGAIYVVILAAILWIVLEYLPVGRRLYVIGDNPRAAELVGIPSARYIIGAFVASGTLTAVAGVVLASRLHVAQSSVGPDLLLPAFTGAMLGATTIRPGRVNAPGTVLAVLLLAAAVSGLQQLGASFYVEALFNGAMLVLAVGVAGYFARREKRARARQQAEYPPPGPESPAANMRPEAAKR